MKGMKKIVFFPKYSPMGASSRYRIYEYLKYYAQAGVRFSIHPLFGDWYLSNIFKHRSKLRILPRMLTAYVKRVWKLLTMDRNSVAYIGAELFPYVPYGIDKILSIRKIPYIIEFDDAIFHNYDRFPVLRNKTKKVIENASHIITGSKYLTDYAGQYNANVTQIPTCVDETKYKTSIPKETGKFIIGWIGSHASSKAILSITGALKKLASLIDYELHLIGFDPVLEQDLQGIPYKLIDWSEKTEVENMRNFSVGIMPLKDTPFSRGKCAFKLVQYMATGIPTISSPLQSNIDIDKGTGNLFASTESEWIEAFLKIANDREHYKSIGRRNKELAMGNYTFQSNYKK
ncbi:MAG: glycosyltransferase, partial [Muribaculaceae bacterium]|nr:glycosyltransferase [Muribaculaceae bacterium]